jgi:prevent-host-death family protein
MESVSLKEFRLQLSKWLARVAKGTPLRITNRNKPYLVVSPLQSEEIPSLGRSVPSRLEPVLSRKRSIDYLRILREDRDE